jgi:hypothetical protein
VFLINSALSFAQTSENQSVVVHSPKKASIYSAVLPGLGQAYNRKYWKIPIIYVGLGAFTYFAIDNQKEFNRYKNAYMIREAGGIDEFSSSVNLLNSYSDVGLIEQMDKWRKFRDLNFVGIAIFYTLQIVDANVDANLFDFDVSDELSMKLFPKTINTNYSRTPVLGIGCLINF